jgi:Na+/H+-dicarboxylate symporter
MKENASIRLIVIIAAAVLAGIAVGFVWPQGMLSISVIGSWYLKALRLIVLPLVITLLVVALASYRNLAGLRRVGLRSLVFFAATSSVAVVIGLVLALLVRPGEGITVFPPPLSPDIVPGQLQSLRGFLESIVPVSVADVFGESLTIGAVLVFVLTGYVLSQLGAKARSVVVFATGLKEAMLQILSWLVMVAPLGLGVLAGSVVAAARIDGTIDDLAGQLGLFTAVVVAGLAIHAIVVLPVVLKSTTSRPGLKYFGNMVPAFLTALATSSKSATFPISYSCIVERNKVEPRASSFILPVSTIFNSNGSALFMVVAGLFIAQAAGISLSLVQVILLGVASVVVSFALAGIPQGGLFGVFAVASIMGFPGQTLAALGALVVVDWLLQPLRTTVNVAGDSVATAVLAESLELKTAGAQPVRKPVRADRQPRERRRTPAPRSDRQRDRAPRSGSDRPRGGHRSSSRGPGGRDSRDDRRDGRQRPGRSTERPERGPKAGRPKSGPRGESPRDSGPAPAERRPVPAPKDSGPAPAEKRPGPAPKDDAQLKVDFSTSEPPRDTQLAEEAPVETKETVKDRLPADVTDKKPAPPAEGRSGDASDSGKTQEAQPISYGRKLARRGRAVKEAEGTNGEKTDKSDLPLPENNFSNENISFGRGKRKKER